MATKTKAWSSGSGNATIQYSGQGNGSIVITSDANDLYESRSMQITVDTTRGGTIERTVTISQAAKERIDLTNAVVTAANQTYSGSAKTPAPTVKLNGETIPSTGYDVTYINNTNAGTATVTITGKGGYKGSASGTFTIAKANPVYVAPTANSRTYNTSSAALLVAGSNTTPGTFTYATSQSGTYGSTIPSKTDAGTYTTYWKFTPTDTNNYNSVGATAIQTTISPKTVSSPTITLSQSTYTYSGSECKPTATVKDGSTTIASSEYTVSYSNNVNAGTGTVTITDKSGGNYTVSGSKTFTINKATGVAGVSGRSLTYGRSAQNLITVSGNTGTVHYRLGTSGSWSTTIPTATNASDYTIYYYVDASANYNAIGSSSSPSNVTTTIAKATPVLSTTPSKRTGLVYSGSAQNLFSGGAMKHSSSDSTSVAGTFTYDQGTNAGTYSNKKWYFTPNDTTNYNSTNGTISGDVTISKANPTYTAPAATNPTFTGGNIYIIGPGSTSHGTIQFSSDGSTWSTSRPTALNAGSYTRYWRLVGDSNHNDVASTAVTCTIKKRDLTITAKDQTISYGSSIATNSSQVTVTGFYPNADALATFTLTPSTSNVTSNGTITPSAATTNKGIENYNVTYVAGNLTITAVPATLTAAPTAKTLYYSGSSQALVNAGSANGGTLYYKATTTNSKPSSTSGFSSSIPTGTNYGTYYVWYYVKGDSNHTDTSIDSSAVRVLIVNPSDYVDLGLTSGRLWAKGNIVKDAQGNYSIGNPTDYGCYFSWGNIEGHNESEGYNWGAAAADTYASTPGGQLKANVNISTNADYDAAVAQLGTPWHIPTMNDLTELYNETDRQATTIDGVAGFKVMKKTDHDVFIFIPKNGRGNGTGMEYKGERGYSWLGNGHGNTTQARGIYVYGSTFASGTLLSRYQGLSIRPVI